MEKLDYKKIYKQLYVPKTSPSIIDVPTFTYIMIGGKGDPNEEAGEYKEAVALLYALCYAIKMSKKGTTPLPGYFEYVVAPLEGLWWDEDGNELFPANKASFYWTAMIAQPDFVDEKVFAWACQQVEKKGFDTSKVRLSSMTEGLCVTCMHLGSYDDEPLTIEKMKTYLFQEGYQLDYEHRKHHELYLSDPRRCKQASLRTVLRLPIKERV